MTPTTALRLSALLLACRLILMYWMRIEDAQRLTLGEADFDVRVKVSVWTVRCATLRTAVEGYLGRAI